MCLQTCSYFPLIVRGQRAGSHARPQGVDRGMPSQGGSTEWWYLYLMKCREPTVGYPPRSLIICVMSTLTGQTKTPTHTPLLLYSCLVFLIDSLGRERSLLQTPHQYTVFYFLTFVSRHVSNILCVIILFRQARQNRNPSGAQGVQRALDSGRRPSDGVLQTQA